MRYVPILILLVPIGFVNAAAPPRAKLPHLDVNGDPLPGGAIARLGTVRFQPHDPCRKIPWRWHTAIATVALSPDGRTVAAARNGEKKGTQIDFMDTSTGKSVRKLDLAAVPVDHRMQFTPDGKSLVFSGWWGIQMVNTQTGAVGLTLDTHQLRDGEVAITTDGKWMAAQPLKHLKHAPVVVWDTKTGKEVMSLPGRGAWCKGLAFGPGRKRLLLWSLVPTQVDAKSIGFDAKSEAVLACIDINTRKIVGETTVGDARLVALCPDGETVAIEAADHRSVRIRHLPTGTDRCAIPAQASRFSFAPDGRVLLTIDGDGRAALWDARKGDKIRDLEGNVVNKDFVILGTSKDGRTIAVLDGGWVSAPRVVVWNAATGKRIGRPHGHEGTVTCIAYAADGRVLTSGSIDRTVRLWDAATGKHLRLLAVHKGAITAVAISPNGKFVASSSQSGVTRLSNVADGKTVAEFAGPERGATALSFSQDGKRLFMGGGTPEVLAREVAGGKEVIRLKTGDDGAVMGFGNGGVLAITANGEIRDEATAPRLRVWDLSEQRSVASFSLTIKNDLGNVRCDAASFSPDGRMLASSQVSEYQGIRPSYGAAQLRLWERVSGEPVRTLGPVISKLLAFSPNGRLLASTGAGQSGHLVVGYGLGVDVWDTLTGEKAGALPVTPECVAFSPDGARMATGGRDHCVLIWEAPKVRQRKMAKAPSPAERDAWWAALGGDARGAYKAIGQMLDDPEHAAALLKERVCPVQAGDPATAAKLIAQLGSEVFAERERAERALEKMGEGVAHLLTKAIHGNVDLELRRRAEGLLKKWHTFSTYGKKHHRAVLTLEWIGTPAARALLRNLAGGAPNARLTVEARAALKRLER
jgi:WD40 repeat protein